MTAGAVAGARSPEVSVAIRRAQGTVVVMVGGAVDRQGAWLLQRVLSDLIEGQGNLRVLVDLTEADLGDVEASKVFDVPAEQARRHRCALTFLLQPSPSVSPSSGPGVATGPRPGRPRRPASRWA